MSNQTFAIKKLPHESDVLVCTNSALYKTILIKTNSKITCWYTNEQNKSIKIRGTLINVNDSFIYIRKNQMKENVKIPIHKIECVSKKYALNTIVSIAAFLPTSIISVNVIKLLNRVSTNNNTPGYTPNDGNGLAGVLGIVAAVIMLPLFILSTIFMIKQLTYKKMQTNKGWIFKSRKM